MFLLIFGVFCVLFILFFPPIFCFVFFFVLYCSWNGLFGRALEEGHARDYLRKAGTLHALALLHVASQRRTAPRTAHRPPTSFVPRGILGIGPRPSA